MKIRNGFVSNSSSSSFCIMGVEFNGSNSEDAWDKFKGTGLRVESAISNWDDSVYVGLWPDDMKDDETLLQFKNRILEKLGSDYKLEDLGWVTDGGYNG